MLVVTAGKAFNDIDAFVCAIAYAHLLRVEGEEARAVFDGPLNHSITAIARAQSNDYTSTYTPNAADEFIYVDLSDPVHFAFYTEGVTNVREIFDHHYGFEAYWQERIGERSHIERIGAAATLIWEEFVKRGKQNAVTPEIANLLLLAIFQNTLNFKSPETTARDHAAYAALTKQASLSQDWQERYSSEMLHELSNNFEQSITNDTKIFADAELVFSQFEITSDAHEFLKTFKADIDAFFSTFDLMKCLVNIIDVNTEVSVLYSNESAWLHTVVKPLFDHIVTENEQALTVPLIQRKRVVKMLNEAGAI